MSTPFKTNFLIIAFQLAEIFSKQQPQKQQKEKQKQQTQRIYLQNDR